MKIMGYNFTTGNFEDITNGKRLDPQYFKDAATTARRAGAQTVGATTIKRAAFLNSLLRKEGQPILVHFSGQSGAGRRLNELLKGLLYSTSKIQPNMYVRYRPIASVQDSKGKHRGKNEKHNNFFYFGHLRDCSNRL